MAHDKIKLDFIPLMSPSIAEEDIEAVARVLRTGMLVQGSVVAILEQKLASFIRSPSAALVSSGTATLHLALVALGIGKGDEVIVPAFSYIATANVVELVGATPVFTDIDLRTFNIDTSQIEDKITSKTKAIIPVHEFGLSCDISRVMAIAKARNIPVIEDAACALGATEDGQPVGTFGILGSFSFHPRKAISSGEGGVLTSSDEKLINLIKVLRNHGIENIDGKAEFTAAGFNYRMTDFQAALLESQLSRITDIIRTKGELASVYFNEISNKQILLPVVPENKKHTWQTFHILLPEGIDRDGVIVKLRNAGIGTNYGAQCIPAQRYYQQKYHLDCKKMFPHALRAYSSGLAIPIYEKLHKKDIRHISKKITNLI